MAEMQLEQRTVEDVPTLALSGELNLMTAPQLRSALLRQVDKDEASLVLDLTGLAFMDTSGLATLIEARMRSNERGGQVILFGLAPRIADVFSIARVGPLFTIVEDEREAISAWQGRRG